MHIDTLLVQGYSLYQSGSPRSSVACAEPIHVRSIYQHHTTYVTIIGPNYIIYVGEYNVNIFLMTLLDGSDEEGTT